MSPQALPCGPFYRLRSPKCSPEGEITRNPLSHNKRWRRGCPSRTLESQPRGGLYVFIPRAGDRFWTFRYMRQGKARELGLGPLHSVSLVEARERARQARQCLLDGGDPVEIRHEASAAAKVERLKTVTFRQAARDFLQTSRIEGFKNDRHRGQWRSTLETYAFPVIPEEERAMMAIVNGAEVIPMRKPKSAPIVLEPARLDNVSQFPSAIGNVDPAPDFPDMPSFLDRRKQSAPEATPR